MKAEGRFLVYCLEIYKKEKNITGKQVLELFKRYGIMEYVQTFYESLHTTGGQYTIEDLDDYIASRQTV